MAEVAKAIEALTPRELVRLRGYARLRARSLGVQVHGLTYEDLMAEAVTATLAGNRRWNKGAVDMVGHLCGVMRSLSSHCNDSAAFHEEPLMPWHDAQNLPEAERRLSASQELERIRHYFREDMMVSQVIEAFAEGMKGPEIKEHMRLSQREYETVLKRLRRGVQRLTARDNHEPY